MITYLIDSLFETPKDLKTLKLNKLRHLDAYNIIDNFLVQDKPSYSSIDNIDEILEKLSYPSELKEIIITFKNYIDPINFETCINKLNNLKINYFDLIHDIKKYLQNFCENEGIYIPKENTIDIYKVFDKKNVLTHEFLHMASTGKNQTSGFCTNLDDIWIGNGLDEGYTELLNKKIFKNKKISYIYNVEIVELLELFFDKPKDMEYAYFHNNIFIVYQTFLKYGTKEEFLSLLQILDNLIETNIPIYKKVTVIKTKINLYTILKRSQNKDKILAAEQILETDPLIKLLKNKIILLANKPKYKKKIKSRRSKYGNSKLIKVIQELLNNEYWNNKLIRLKIERMEDEEFVSELLFLILDKQISDSTPQVLDKKYEKYKNNSKGLIKAKSDFIKIIEFIEKLSLEYDRYKNIFGRTHLYTLFSIAWYCVENKIDEQKIAKDLNEFYVQYFSKELPYENYFKEYKDACSSRTKYAGQRIRRMNAVLKYCNIL